LHNLDIVPAEPSVISKVLGELLVPPTVVCVEDADGAGP
jgi:hypothetical protein